jgi:hypothetical protein
MNDFSRTRGSLAIVGAAVASRNARAKTEHLTRSDYLKARGVVSGNSRVWCKKFPVNMELTQRHRATKKRILTGLQD